MLKKIIKSLEYYKINRRFIVRFKSEDKLIFYSDSPS